MGEERRIYVLFFLAIPFTEFLFSHCQASGCMSKHRHEENPAGFQNFLNHGDSGTGCCSASPGKASVAAASLCPVTLQGRESPTLSVSLHLENKIFKSEAKLVMNLKETRTTLCKFEQTHLYYLNNSSRLQITLISLSKWCKK